MIKLFRRHKGNVVSFLLGFLASYLVAMLFDRQPAMRFEILSRANVIEVNDSTEFLQISFAGTDLRDSKQSLSSVVFRLHNNGRAAIRENDYSTQHPLTLTIHDARLADVPVVVNASTSVLSNTKVAEPIPDFTSTITQESKPLLIPLPKLVLNPNDFIDVKLLLLSESQFDVKLEGMMAGVDIETVYGPKPIIEEREISWKLICIGVILGVLLERGMNRLFGKLNASNKRVAA